jgi:hypothetical protein
MCQTIRLACVAAMVMFSASAALADPIRITSGSLQFTGSANAMPLTLAGDGFTLTANASLHEGLLGPYFQCTVPECVAGSTIDLHSIWVGSGLSNATVTFEGQTYNNVGSFISTDSAVVEWTGSLGIPLGFTGGSLSAPVSFGGQFLFVPDPSQPQRQVNLFGAGTATLTFIPWAAPEFANAFVLQSAVFDMNQPAATPEPASMLLLGTGVGALLVRARRRRAR